MATSVSSSIAFYENFSYTYEQFCHRTEVLLRISDLDRYRLYPYDENRLTNALQTALRGIKGYIGRPANKTMSKAYAAISQLFPLLEGSLDQRFIASEMRTDVEDDDEFLRLFFTVLDDGPAKLQFGGPWFYSKVYALISKRKQVNDAAVAEMEAMFATPKAEGESLSKVEDAEFKSARTLTFDSTGPLFPEQIPRAEGSCRKAFSCPDLTEDFVYWWDDEDADLEDEAEYLWDEIVPWAEADVGERNIVTKETNVTLLDERDTVTEDTRPNQRTIDVSHVSMSEDNWSLREILGRPQILRRVEWNSTDAMGRKLLFALCPGGMITTPHQNIIDMFQYFRADVVVRVQVNGTKFHAGRALLAFVPHQTIRDNNKMMYSTSQLSGGPSVMIDAAVSNSAVLRIPFCHMLNYFQTYSLNSQPNYLGKIELVVFNELRVAEGMSKKVDMTVWVHFENVQMHGPMAPHKLVGLPDTMKPEDGRSEPKIVAESGPIERLVPNTTSNTALGDARDQFTRLSLSPNTATKSDIESTAGSGSDMNLKRMLMTPTRMGHSEWKTTHEAGKEIGNVAVYPTSCNVVKQDNRFMRWSPSMLAYCARAAKFWRGGLRYRIQIVASQMHSGRLMFSFMPGYYSSKDSLVSTANVLIVDLQERHELEFIVPYMSDRSWLRCDRFELVMSEPQDRAANQFTGFLSWTVLNALTCPANISQTVDINFYVSAAEDFELGVMSDFLGVLGNPAEDMFKVEKGEEPVPKAESLAAETMVAQNDDMGVINIVKGHKLLSHNVTNSLSENMMDLAVVFQRYQPIFQNTSVMTKESYLAISNNPMIGSTNMCFNDKSGTVYRSHLGHFGEVFTFWKGSLRYKLIFGSSSAGTEYSVFHVPSVFVPQAYTFTTSKQGLNKLAGLQAYGTQIAVSRQQGSLEFEIPFYTNMSQLRTGHSQVPNGYSSTGTIFILARNSESSSSTYTLMQSAGRDFEYVYPKAPCTVLTHKASEQRGTTMYEQDVAGEWEICITDEVTPGEAEPTPVAEAWNPFGFMTTRLENVDKATDAITKLAETSNNVLGCAAKKLGLASSEEEDEGEADPADGFTAQLHGISNPLGGILSTLQSFLEGLPGVTLKVTTMDWVVNVSDLVSGIVAFSQSTNVILRTMALITIVTKLFGTAINTIKSWLSQLISSVVEALNGDKQGNQSPVAESSAFDFVPAIIASVTVAITALGFKQIPDDKETTQVVKGVTERIRLFNFSCAALSNIKGMWVQMQELVTWTIEKILEFLAPTTLANLQLQKEFADVVTWAEFIDTIEGSNYEDRVNYDHEFKMKIYRAIDAGERYNELCVRGELKREATVIRQYCMKIREIGLIVEKSENALPFRIDPFCVAMFGNTGVGKSGCITSLAFKMMDNMGYPRHNRWVAVNPSEKFFTENYRQQTAVYFDDISLFTDVEQWKKFCSLKSNTQFPLDMAFKKGEYFNSDFIFQTTNVPYPRPVECQFLPSLWRRRDVLIETKFASPEIEAGIANKERARDLNHDHAVFRIRDSDISDPDIAEDTWMTFDALVTKCTEYARAHMVTQQAKLAHDVQLFGYRLPAKLNPPGEEVVADVTVPAPVFDVNVVGAPEAGPSTAPQAGEAVAEAAKRVLDVTKVMNLEIARFMRPEVFEALVYNEETHLFLMYDGDYIEEWEAFVSFAGASGENLQPLLKMCSFIPENRSPLRVKITGKLQGLRDYLGNVWASLKEKVPMLGLLEGWPVKLAAAAVCFAMIFGVGRKIIHKCICVSLTHFGYRCGLCGKWPQLETCKDKEWMLSEWRSVYGEVDAYEAGRCTSIEEETNLKEIYDPGSSFESKIWIGTKKKKAEGGPYSDVTRGASSTRVVANQGPYQSETNGQLRPKIVAHGQRTTELIERRLQPATYRVQHDGGRRGVPTAMNCLAIGGRRILIPSHFFFALEEDEVFEIYHSNAWMTIYYKESRVHKIMGKDLVVFDMPVQFHLHKDMMKHFISEMELSKFKRGPAILSQLRRNLRYTENLVEVEAVDKVHYTYEEGELKGKYDVRNAWKYPFESAPGACGSPLLARSDQLGGQILGVHSCGNGIHGWSQLVTREMLEKIDYDGPKLGTPLPVAEAEFTNQVPPGHFGRIGKASQGDGYYQSDRTTIIPTVIHDMVTKHVTEPAALSSRDPRLTVRKNIVREGISKYGLAPREFPTEHVAAVKEAIIEDIRTWKVQRPAEVLSVEEAISGIEGLEGFDRLPMSTSPGYPYVLSRAKGTVGKAYLFDVDCRRAQDAELVRRLDERIGLAKLGERVQSVWLNCLKDERRPLEKVAKGSTRLFVIPPVDLSIMTRMYMLDYTVAMKDNRGFSSCKVGIDPQSMEWTDLYYYLAGFSEWCVAGDYTRFDGTIPPQLTEVYYECTDAFYEIHGECTPEDRRVRRVLMDEAIHTICLANVEFFLAHTGNNSGDPTTVAKNSVVNGGYIRLAWLGLAERRMAELATMASFKKLVRMAIYGDDNILAIKEEVLHWFNQETIAAYLEEYGIVYTNESKTGVDKYKKLDECTFLKQAFGNHETLSGVKVPLMKKDTIFELLNWTRIAPDQDELLESNCNDALRFAYFYGQGFFEETRNKILGALKTKEKRFSLMTYRDFHFWFMFVIGKIGARRAEADTLQTIASSGNGTLAKLVGRTFESIPYAVLSMAGVLKAEESTDRTDDRHAVAIPSGEGKSWLTKNYPYLFVDHDDILLPAATRRMKEKWSVKHIMGMYDEELPKEDRRVLLVHHPNDTKRQMLGSFVLPKPNYIRANAYQRLKMSHARRMERPERNRTILELVRRAEPQLFDSSEFKQLRT